MSAQRRAASLLLGALLRPQYASAQPWSAPAEAPSEEALAALERDVSARANREAVAQRRRIRPLIGVGVSVHRAASQSADGFTLERQPGAAPLFAIGLRRGLGSLLEGDLALELAAPVTVTAFPAALASATAMQPCAGTRRFELPVGSAIDVTLAATVRARLIRPAAPFYLGLGLRLTTALVDARGVATAQCLGTGATPPPQEASVDRLAWATRVDAALETGYRFGEAQRWDVGLRMVVTALGSNDTRVGGAQWFVAWHFR